MAGDDHRKQAGDGDPNVVSLAEARKRQRTVRADKDGKQAAGDGRSGPRRAGAGRGEAYGAKRKDGAASPTSPFRKALQYGQFVLFLAIVAYLMHLCQSPA